MKNIAILISNKGTGTNLQAIIDAVERGEIKGNITVVVSNTSKAHGLVRAKKYNIPTEIFGWKRYEKLGKTRREYSKYLAKLLKKYNPDLVVFAGWILILTQEFFEEFPNVINIHPGLIPDIPGERVKFPDGTQAPINEEMHTDDAISSFLKNKHKFAGSTIHFVTKNVDWGPVVFRDFEKIKPGDTVDSLYSRLKKKEHKMLIRAISLYCNDKLVIEGSRVKVLQ